ncbi:MAG: EAL domain-containing protein [Burkholderiales bacterium]|nr:EAL domain-containing protein [Burkholderiales bacterium]
MQGASGSTESPFVSRDGLADRLVYAWVVYLLPIAAVFLSLLALNGWHEYEAKPQESPLVFRALADERRQWSHGEALLALQNAPAVIQQSTSLSTAPFWVRVDLPAGTTHPDWLEFPSRHANRVSCWLDDHWLGEADRQGTSGALRWLRAGFALAVPADAAGQSVLCRLESIGPARIGVLARSHQDAQAAAERHARGAGWLDGGLIVLGVFLFVTALISRNANYVLFSAWMLLNLRMAALSAGTDFQWLGQRVPGDWLSTMRLITLALYFTCTYALFRNFFRESLDRLGVTRGLSLLAWSCPPLLLLSVVLPFERYLPIIWAWTGFSVLLVCYYLIRILWLTRSQVAMWYGGSMAVTLFASLAEVLGASSGSGGITEVVNSVTAALFSGLLASLAVAAQMKEERDQRRDAQRRLQSTFEALPIGLFSATPKGQFTQTNPALVAMLGAPPPGSLGRWSNFFGQEAWDQLLREVGEQQIAQLELIGPGGRQFLVRATLASRVVEGLVQDVTEQNEATEKLRFMALNDPLTKVLNRRGVEAAMLDLQKQLPSDRRMAMGYLDLDRFKLLNDLYGHAAGDVVLQQVCARLRELLSKDMPMGRVGGDEFVILMPGVSMELACLIARGLLTAIGNQPYQVGDRAFQVRGSMGLVEIEADTAFKDAMSSADRACRVAKSQQSDGLVVFEHDDRQLEEMAAEMQLVARLAAGGDVEGLHLHMQPIMSLRQPHAALNFEVLLRMKDASGKPVPTGRLIAAGEQSGRMSMIDRWVLASTLAWMKRHKDQLIHTQFVCVNLSGASLNDERFIEAAFDMLQDYAEVAPLLCLEVTESVALHDLANTRRFIHQVRQFGARVALDDFGAGYTSFSYLKDLPGDLLKIDGSFIVNMNEHPANIAIVEAIVSLARNLGMKVIAEWAEDAATVETLAEIGVDYVQGFAIARSQDPDVLLGQASSAAFVTDPATRELVEQLQLRGTMPDFFVSGTRGKAA